MFCSKNAGSGAFALGLMAAVAVEASDPYFETQHFSGSGVCAVCHNGIYDQLGNDVSIERDWSATMMANASRNPLWQAKFASELLRLPMSPDLDLQAVVNDKCTRCHAPMANEEARDDSVNPKFFADGFSNPANPYHDAAMDGVSCTLCHQIADGPNLGTPAGFSGDFIIEDFANPLDRPMYGSYVSPRINPMQWESGFTPQFGAHITDSALCASCHNLTTPVLNADGSLFSTTPETEFPEQMVYTEWQNSAYADGAELEQSCQSCHLARADGVKIANRPPFLPLREDFRRHGFYGGNVLMLDMLDMNREALGVGGGDFAASIEATRQTLHSAAELVIEEAALDGYVLTVRVRVINKGGHKLPTSFPSRRVSLHLKVSDTLGTTLFESGRPETDDSGVFTGAIAGVDGDFGPLGYEHHYQEITSADQVQVYEPIMVDSDGNQTYTLLRAAGYLKDNRIPPKGFDKAAVPNQIAVEGDAAQDPDFGDGSDLVTYRVDLIQVLDPAAGGIVISAALNYQTLSHGFVRDLRQDAGDPTVASFLGMYDASQVRVEKIAEAPAMTISVGPGLAARLVAAVLPVSRSVQVGSMATAFATMINTGTSELRGCGITPITEIPGTFFYRTTNPATNEVVGLPNDPATIAPGAAQSYVIGFTPTAAFGSTDVELQFDCESALGVAAIAIPGVNTILLSASDTPIPDVIALVATPTMDGIINIPGFNGSAAFAVASANVGVGGTLWASADSGAASLPIDMAICATDAAGQCLSPPAPQVAFAAPAGSTPSFAVFLSGQGEVAFVPASNRVFVRFVDSNGTVRGATSVAVRTQ